MIRALAFTGTTMIGLLLAPVAMAETLSAALARAYNSNPQFNSERAGVRAGDEDVPRALAGMRPKVAAEAFAGLEARSLSLPGEGRQAQGLRPRSVGVSIEQPLFDGFRTRNSVRSAEGNVLARRERLRLTEQTVLLAAATAYMNVLRDLAMFKLQGNNVAVLVEQLRQGRERYQEGQITQTDIAQAEARLASGKSQLSLAKANMENSLGVYRQVIGLEARSLNPGRPVDTLLPRSMLQAEKVAFAEHPAIAAALHGADVAKSDVLVLESEMYPSLSLVGTFSSRADNETRGERRASAALMAKLSVPIYSGGDTSARVRQGKETAGQKRLDVEILREDVRAGVRASWSALEAIKDQIKSAQVQIEASQRALLGVREEARVGQRTTLDILNAQQELLSARISLVVAQRDRVVASYAVLAAVGRLSARTLGLAVQPYDPSIHFDQVKGNWRGTRTPNGQ